MSDPGLENIPPVTGQSLSRSRQAALNVARVGNIIGGVKARLAVIAALALGVTAAAAAAAAVPHGSALRHFSYSGAGTNSVNIPTGELRELWTGQATPFGRITAHVAGWIQRPDPRSMVIHSSMVIVDPRGDVLIGACTGTGILPNPNGSEDWTCDATGGTGKFKRSRGRWTLHIVISRISIKNGTQRNRFTERGAGRLSWGR